jgi:rhodanese-related sulfurtransferase
MIINKQFNMANLPIQIFNTGFSVFILIVSALTVSCSQSEIVDGDISQGSLIEQMASDNAPIILDVRTPEEYSAGHIPGAINIPHNTLTNRIDELSEYKDEKIVVHCQSGRRAGLAEGVLREAGYNKILHLEGDMAAWRESKLPLEGN